MHCSSDWPASSGRDRTGRLPAWCVDAACLSLLTPCMQALSVMEGAMVLLYNTYSPTDTAKLNATPAVGEYVPLGTCFFSHTFTQDSCP